MNRILLACGMAAVLFAACKKDDDNNSNNISDADRTFMQMAAYSNNDEIDAGTLASTKGNMASVRSFGSMMVTDHGMAQTDLQSLASQKGVTLPSGPDSLHIAMKQMMMNLSGRDFDTAYMNAQVRDHQATITLMQNEISNGSNQDVKNYASSKLPTIQMHYHMADSIARTL